MIRKRNFYSCLIFVFSIITGVSLFFAYYFFELRDKDLGITRIYSSENISTNYALLGSDNKFYNNINSGDKYNLDSIKSISAYYNYSNTFSDYVEGKYNYYITSVIVNNGKEEYVIDKTDMREFEFSGNVISVNTSAELDYPKLHSELIKFNDGNESNAFIRNKITIFYNIYNGYVNRYVTDTKELNIDLVLENDLLSIKTIDSKNKKTPIFSNNRQKNERICRIIALEFAGSSLLFVLVIILLSIKSNRIEKDYCFIKERLEKKYKKHLTELDALPNLIEKEVIFVKNMKGLVEKSIGLGRTIDYKEVIEDCETTYILMDEDKVYVYNLKR